MHAETLWTAYPLPTLLLGEGDRLDAINPAAEHLIGQSERSVKGAVLWELAAFSADLTDAFSRVHKTGSPLYVDDIVITFSKSRQRHCDLHLAPYDTDKEQVLLTMLVREEAGHLPQPRSTRRAVRSAIGMAEMMAHEIKNPLAGITGAAQLLSMSLSKEDRELTDLIVEESKRIVKLLEQVEEFGNLSPPQFAPVNLHDILDRARRSAALGFGAQIAFTEEYDPSLPPAWGDADQLLQVLLNLIKNASEATGAGGQITLTTRYEHGVRRRREDGVSVPLPLQIEITDNGPGIPPDILSDIFDPFVSGKENGTGLGLALTAKIITAHDGLISAQSTENGTTMRLSLPRADETAQEKDR